MPEYLPEQLCLLSFLSVKDKVTYQWQYFHSSNLHVFQHYPHIHVLVYHPFPLYRYSTQNTACISYSRSYLHTSPRHRKLRHDMEMFSSFYVPAPLFLGKSSRYPYHRRLHWLKGFPVHTRVGTLIRATIYLQLIQNRYMFRSFTVLQCSHQNCVQPVASDVEVVGYL